MNFLLWPLQVLTHAKQHEALAITIQTWERAYETAINHEMSSPGMWVDRNQNVKIHFAGLFLGFNIICGGKMQFGPFKHLGSSYLP